MIEEVLPNLYKMEIPLPRNPLKAVNSYVIKDNERNLMIDTGMNRPACQTAMKECLNELDLDLRKTDFFISHFHADHAGLVSELATDSSTVYLSRWDGGIVSGKGGWKGFSQSGILQGFPLEELQSAQQNHPGYKYSPKKVPEITCLDEGDVLSAGDYTFQCVYTPGHTPGHMCLYEKEKKLFMAGDHILDDITPNIQSWSETDDALGDYLASLEKVYTFDISLVLPGHRRLIENCRGRIDELKEHHRNRLDEVLSILGNDSKTAYDVAAGMTWDIDYKSFDLFPVMQKWFATGEAMAHLRYHEEKQIIQREMRDNRAFFSVTG